MIDHQYGRDSLAVYHDLPATERGALDEHLAGCAECRETFAAYERQDAALADIRTIRPRARHWHPGRLAPAGRAQPAARWRHRKGWLSLFGDALALAGIAALLWMFVLQAQYAWRLNPAGAMSSPAQLVPEPGIAIPPAVVTPPSPWLPALPWMGVALLVVG